MALLTTYDLQTLVLTLILIAVIVLLPRLFTMRNSANTKQPEKKFTDYYLI